MTIAKVLELIKNGERIIAWVKENENSNYALLEDITYPPIDCSRWFEPFTYRDELVEIIPTDETHILLTIFAFDGKRKIWNGPSIVGNIDEGLMLASLPHDVLYDRMEIIEKCTGVKQDKIRAFADVLLANLMEKYGSGKVKSKAAYTAVKIFGGLYHWINKIICLGIILTAFSCSYPTIIDEVPPNPRYQKLDGLNITTVVTQFISQVEVKPEPTNTQNDFVYKSFGSPDCSKCVEDKSVQIKDLKITKSGLSYKWASSTKLDAWGLAYDDASALAIIGYEKNGEWRFCKFDWISSSRLTRDFKNINSGYNGINADEFYSAKHHGFFIMSKNGTKRTNIITD